MIFLFYELGKNSADKCVSVRTKKGYSFIGFIYSFIAYFFLCFCGGKKGQVFVFIVYSYFLIHSLKTNEKKSEPARTKKRMCRKINTPPGFYYIFKNKFSLKKSESKH